MTFNFFAAPLVCGCLAIAAAVVSFSAQATGMQPDTPLLVVLESDGSAQMGLLNTDNQPLLLHTTIIELPEDKGPALYALPPVTRVDANGRQVVRFLLEKSSEPLTVQHLKRVRFEGIPPAVKDNSDNSAVHFTVAQELPVIISPKGLEQDPEPWKKIIWKLSGNQIIISNPSPFVARLSREVDLLPSGQRVALLTRTYILPNESLTIPLPAGANAATVMSLRLQPASPYGFSVGPYEVPLLR